MWTKSIHVTPLWSYYSQLLLQEGPEEMSKAVCYTVQLNKFFLRFGRTLYLRFQRDSVYPTCLTSDSQFRTISALLTYRSDDQSQYLQPFYAIDTFHSSTCNLSIKSTYFLLLLATFLCYRQICFLNHFNVHVTKFLHPKGAGINMFLCKVEKTFYPKRCNILEDSLYNLCSFWQ